MNRRRVGLAQLMASVAALAIGLGAIRAGTESAAQLSVLAFVLALLVGTTGAIVHRSRGAWVGFAVFGWYQAATTVIFAVVLAYANNEVALALGPWRFDQPVGWAVEQLHPQPTSPPRPPGFGSNELMRTKNGYYQFNGNVFFEFTPKPGEVPAIDAYCDARVRFDEWPTRVGHARTAGRAFLGIAFALLGSALGRCLDRRPSADDLADEPPDPDPDPSGEHSRP
jgi:hypothetical protein